MLNSNQLQVLKVNVRLGTIKGHKTTMSEYSKFSICKNSKCLRSSAEQAVSVEGDWIDGVLGQDLSLDTRSP